MTIRAATAPSKRVHRFPIVLMSDIGKRKILITYEGITCNIDLFITLRPVLERHLSPHEFIFLTNLIIKFHIFY